MLSDQLPSPSSSLHLKGTSKNSEVNWRRSSLRQNRRFHSSAGGASPSSFVANLSSNSANDRRLSARFWLTSLFALLLFPALFLLLTTHTFAFPNFPLKMTRPTGPQRALRVMTFNIWLSGERVKNGLQKIADQIKLVEPDIVVLQELQTVEVGTNLTELLGTNKWTMIHHPDTQYPDTAIVTKHKFVSTQPIVLQFKRNISDFLFHEQHYANNSVVTYGTGASIELDDGQRVNVFSMHLDYKSYGPYAANNKEVRSEKQIMAGERNKHGYGRSQNIEQLIDNEHFQQFVKLSNKQPLIVAGDFNCPSHLDWTDETKNDHGGWKFEWPATKLLINTGFLDSFRQIHPNVLEVPGLTWSTVQKDSGPEWDWSIPEPQDRIDFIFYKPSSIFRPVRSSTYAGNGTLKPIPDQWENDWPSDHYAVITDFTIDLMVDDSADLMLQNGAISSENASADGYDRYLLEQ